MSYFIMRRGPTPSKTFPIIGKEVLLGRGTKNDIVIDDNAVSREHLKLIQVDTGYELRDLNSSNGTFVNGQPVGREVWVLEAQCIVELGDHVTLEYHPGELQEYSPQTESVAESLAKTKPKSDKKFQPHYLIVTIHSQKEPAIYPLNKPELTVGRGVNNDIVLVEPEMSRVHFRLKLVPMKGYTLEDLGSTNGTMVNGELVEEPVLLTTNDIIQIGTMVNMQYSSSPDTFLAQAKTEILGKRDPIDSQETTPLRTPTPRRTTAESMSDIVLDRTSEPKRITSEETTSSRKLTDKVLITYAREDWDAVVEKLVKTLNQKNVRTWVDQNLDPESDDWQRISEQARLECPLMVVVVSQDAMKSDVVKRNWRHFHNREKPIILFVHQLVDNLPIGSDKLTRVEFNPALPDVGYQRLATEIQRLKK